MKLNRILIVTLLAFAGVANAKARKPAALTGPCDSQAKEAAASYMSEKMDAPCDPNTAAIQSVTKHKGEWVYTLGVTCGSAVSTPHTVILNPACKAVHGGPGDA